MWSRRRNSARRRRCSNPAAPSIVIGQLIAGRCGHRPPPNAGTVRTTSGLGRYQRCTAQGRRLLQHRPPALDRQPPAQKTSRPGGSGLSWIGRSAQHLEEHRCGPPQANSSRNQRPRFRPAALSRRLVELLRIAPRGLGFIKAGAQMTASMQGTTAGKDQPPGRRTSNPSSPAPRRASSRATNTCRLPSGPSTWVTMPQPRCVDRAT